MAEHIVVLLAAFSCLISTSTCEDSPLRCSSFGSYDSASYLPELETKQGTPISSIRITCTIKGRDTHNITSFMSNLPPEFHSDRLVMVYLSIYCLSPMELHIINSLSTVYNNILLFLRLSGECAVSMQTLSILANATDFRGIYLREKSEYAKVSCWLDAKRIQPEGRKVNFATSLTEIAEACLSLKDLNSITEMFKNTQNVFPNLAKLSVTGWSIKEFSSDQWSSTMPKLQYLDLSGNVLTKPPVFPWNNSTLEIFRQFKRGRRDNKVNVPQNLYIRGLDLSNNHIDDLSSHEFRGLLHKLDLSGNALENIGPTCFHGLQGIQSIDLSYTRMASLPGNLFQGLTSLLHINLGYNMISLINQTLFYGLVNIKMIALNHNRISYVRGGLFKTLNNLEVLRLDSNNIKKMRTNPFSPYSMLRQLKLQNNNLSSFPSWIVRLYRTEEINLSNNQLTRLDLQALPAPYLRVNRFFSKRKRDIDLTDNKISTVKLTPPWALAVVGMWIKKVFLTSPEFSSSILMDVDITLTGNPLTCDCNMFASVKQIRKSLLTNITAEIKSRFSTWQCKWPRGLKHKSILDIEDNQWIHRKELDNCPAECSTCEKRCSDEVIVIDCKGLNLTEVPNSMPQGLIELDLSNNEIKDIPVYDYLINVTVLKLTNNKVEQLNASVVQKLKNVKILLIDFNQLTNLPRKIETLNFTTMALHQNNFNCECETKWMTEWLRKNRGRIRDYKKVLCKSGNPDLRGHQIGSLTDDKFFDVCTVTLAHTSATTPHISPATSETDYPQFTTSKTSNRPSSEQTGRNLSTATIAAFVLCGLLLLTVITIILLYKYRGEVKVFMFTRFNLHPFDRIDDSDPDKIYDAFISYSGDDYQWVVNTLQRRLENHNPPYKLCLHHRDFQVGALIQENIFKSVDHSKRMLMVLSPSFAKSGWCLLEFRFAHQKVLEDRTNYLIIILFDDVDMADLDEEIKLYMRTNTFVRVSDERFWQKLFYALPLPCSAKESTEDTVIAYEEIFAEENRMPLTERPGTVQNETQTKVT